MTGLFFRLAQQHINKRSPGISPVPSPVFPMLLNEQHADPVEGYVETAPDQQVKPEVPAIIATPMSTEKQGNPALKSGAGDKPDSTLPDKSIAVPRTLKSVANPELKASGMDEQVAPQAGTKAEMLENPPSIQPKQPGDTVLPPKSTVVEDKLKSHSSRAEKSNLSAGDQLVSKRTLVGHQLPSSMPSRQNKPSKQKHAQVHAGGIHPTINVSIGQIDVIATREEKPGKKAPARLKPSGPSELEKYHQKRLRGER